jgi:hypothetical protein
MNPFEQQLQLGRELMELNSEWFGKLAELDSQNLSQYVELNQDFAGKLPEVKDIQGFMELQREYGEQLWQSTQTAFQARAELVQQATDANGEAFRKVLSPAEEAKAKAKAKAKPRAKAA